MAAGICFQEQYWTLVQFCVTFGVPVQLKGFWCGWNSLVFNIWYLLEQPQFFFFYHRLIQRRISIAYFSIYILFHLLFEQFNLMKLLTLFNYKLPPVTAYAQIQIIRHCIYSFKHTESFIFLSFSACLYFSFTIFFCALRDTAKHGWTKTEKCWLSPNRSSKGRGPYISQSFSDSLLSIFISLPVCLLLLSSVSHPLSGLTPDEFVLQALSLRLFKLHKKISSYGRGVWQPKEKRNTRVWDPEYFIRSFCDKELHDDLSVGSSKREGKQ